MRQISNRSSIPVELQTLQKAYSSSQYEDWNHMHRDYHTEYLAVRDALANDQDAFCIYCEICLDPQGNSQSDHGHIEHHRPKSQFANLMFDWDNLMYCCITPETCGMAKKRTYFQGFLNPYMDPVQDWVHTNAMTGEMEISSACPSGRIQHAQESLKTLNLNAPGLQRKRQNLLRKLAQEIDSLAEQPDALAWFIDSTKNATEPFITARLQLLNRLIPEG